MTPEFSPRNAASASEHDSSFATTLSSFDARIKQLEKPNNEAPLVKIQKGASFLALLIGILLSLISIFDIFWIKPRENSLRDLENFNKSVNAVADLRQKLVQLHFQSKDPEMVFAVSSMITPQILAHIHHATGLLPKLENAAIIPQLIVLISEAINIYDWKSAEALVDRAVGTTGTPPSLQSEARRQKARLMFLTGRVVEGRKAYEDALNQLRNEPAFGINGSRAYIVADWAVAEFSLGDCGSGSERIRQFIELIRDPEVLPPVRMGLLMTLKTQLGQLPLNDKGCSVPVQLTELN